MKILWVKSDFLHPTTKGGQIRTLEMLRRLHARHEIHYVAFADPGQPEGVRRSGEYATRAYPAPHRAVNKRSASFAWQLLQGLFSPLPVAIARWRSAAMERQVSSLLAGIDFDCVVCDFLSPALNIPGFDRCVLFQHNVETAIWRRHQEHAPDPLRRFYFRLQAERMFALERRFCRAARRVVAVSPVDARLMREWFGLEEVSEIPTGVDLDYFAPQPAAPGADLVFVGSMDWLPNIDALSWFARDVLPLILRRRPECSLAVVGRDPAPEIEALARACANITVTGTVPDIRPYLWSAKVSLAPLRIGGGTRLKIYESMAARVPVVSTTVGAEGLTIHPPEDILIADDPEAFASACLELLDDADRRQRMAAAAWNLVAGRFSWDQVTREFEAILEALVRPGAKTPA